MIIELRREEICTKIAKNAYRLERNPDQRHYIANVSNYAHVEFGGRDSPTSGEKRDANRDSIC